MIKKSIIAFTLATILSAGFSGIADAYTGNSNTGKFHYDDCRWAQKINYNYRVYFDTRDEAIDSGYIPCKVCRP